MRKIPNQLKSTARNFINTIVVVIAIISLEDAAIAALIVAIIITAEMD